MNERFNMINSVKLVVLTGGPGAGKTAILETIKKVLPESTAILPEAASILFNGGFWRLPSITAKASAQRAIFHIQKEMETIVREENLWKLALCDRGSLDGLAYWPLNENDFWKMCNTNLKEELDKYYAVIHLRTPSKEHGYNHQNPLRTESVAMAKEIDDKIAKIWEKHPNYISINSSENFLIKAEMAVSYITNLHKSII